MHQVKIFYHYLDLLILKNESLLQGVVEEEEVEEVEAEEEEAVFVETGEVMEILEEILTKVIIEEIRILIDD